MLINPGRARLTCWELQDRSTFPSAGHGLSRDSPAGAGHQGFRGKGFSFSHPEGFGFSPTGQGCDHLPSIWVAFTEKLIKESPAIRPDVNTGEAKLGL